MRTGADVSKCGNLCQIYPLMFLLGEYEATVDAKNRFLLPGALKKQFPENEKLVLSRGIDENLVLYPIKTWEALVEKLLNMNEFEHNVRKFRAIMLGGATEIELDSAGRVLIPPSLKDHGKLKKDIVLAGDIDKIIVWDAAEYKKLFEETTPQKFSEIAELVGARGNKAG